MNSDKFTDAPQRSLVLDRRNIDTMASLADTLDHLNELIVALDRRMPQVQRAGESAIADAAAELRVAAVKRIGEIERELARRH